MREDMPRDWWDRLETLGTAPARWLRRQALPIRVVGCLPVALWNIVAWGVAFGIMAGSLVLYLVSSAIDSAFASSLSR